MNIKFLVGWSDTETKTKTETVTETETETETEKETANQVLVINIKNAKLCGCYGY